MMLLPCLILGKFMPIRVIFTHFLNEENVTALVGLDSSHKGHEYRAVRSSGLATSGNFPPSPAPPEGSGPLAAHPHTLARLPSFHPRFFSGLGSKCPALLGLRPSPSSPCSSLTSFNPLRRISCVTERSPPPHLRQNLASRLFLQVWGVKGSRPAPSPAHSPGLPPTPAPRKTEVRNLCHWTRTPFSCAPILPHPSFLSSSPCITSRLSWAPAVA